MYDKSRKVLKRIDEKLRLDDGFNNFFKKENITIFDYLAKRGEQINYSELVEHFKKKMHWSEVNSASRYLESDGLVEYAKEPIETIKITEKGKKIYDILNELEEKLELFYKEISKMKKQKTKR